MGGDDLDLPNGPSAGGHLTRWLQGGRDDEKKKASVEAELEKVKRLPAHSTYATHRTRVLTKILHLMSIQVPLAYIPFDLLNGKQC